MQNKKKNLISSSMLEIFDISSSFWDWQIFNCKLSQIFVNDSEISFCVELKYGIYKYLINILNCFVISQLFVDEIIVNKFLIFCVFVNIIPSFLITYIMFLWFSGIFANKFVDKTIFGSFFYDLI